MSWAKKKKKLTAQTETIERSFPYHKSRMEQKGPHNSSAWHRILCVVPVSRRVQRHASLWFYTPQKSTWKAGSYL